jgi:hypothetical protein
VTAGAVSRHIVFLGVGDGGGRVEEENPMTLEQALADIEISEAVQFFHIDALSSMVGMKVDFDMQLTLAASSLYRMMAQRIGREYSHSQAKTVFRNLLDLSGKVEVTAASVMVTLDKRAHNPYLVASGLADQPTPMPWYGNKKLIIRFA